jgi:low temperature requirement protein LtrA
MTANSEDDGQERSTDNIPKQRSRMDLFVDLIWVGIIANLSGTFGKQAYADSGVGIGIAVTEFVLLFIVIWRVWDNLRVYTTQFFVDDILQRNFTLWILVLAVLYGINAPYAFNPTGEGDSLIILIVVYIITKVSFLAANGIQSIWLPFLRRHFYFQLVFTIITIGVWVGAIFVPYPGKLGLLVAANSIEHPVAVFLASPTADRLFAKGLKRVPDVDHCVDRHEGFFIIILGEGVFRLIEGSPSGLGLNQKTWTVLVALILYYMLHWLYFNGDQSKEFVHALRRTWWKPVLWQL